MTENVLLARVDDRLIHGQVMTAWMKLLPAKQIIIIDDKVATDDFMISVLEMAAPKGVKVRVFSCDKATEILAKGIKTPSILLAKSPITYKRLIDGGVDLTAVNLGGMGINETRTTLYKNLAASPEERTAIKEMLDAGVDVKIQVIPADKVVEIKNLL
ncbi:MAG: PTS sugar transporter subunit IIB [Lachnospiraceae bacterium]|nr:PTS sugar transporter subunit IIB [Lachnospiraceae bacterium]